MKRDLQLKLGNFLTPDSLSATSIEIVCDIPLEDFFHEDGLVLPPDAKHSKCPSMDYFKIVLVNIVKGHKTLKRTWRWLKNNPEYLKKLNIQHFPDYTSLTFFVRKRFGKEQFKELHTAVMEYLHNNNFFIPDNLQSHKPKRNTTTIHYEKINEISRFVKKLVIELVKSNKIVNQSYSNKDIFNMVFEALAEDCTSMFDYSTSKRQKYMENKRGDIATSKTIFTRIRTLFQSPEEFDEFLFKVAQKVISVVRKHNPDLFNRRKFTVAVDTILLPTWESVSKSPDPLSILKDGHVKQKGTNKFREYDAISIVVDDYKFVLGFIPLIETDKHGKERNIEKLLVRAKSLVPVGRILLDREFETGSITELFEYINLEYIMPAVERENLKKISKQMNDDILITQGYIKGKKAGKLIIFKTTKATMENEYLYYRTNINFSYKTAEQIKDLYKKRWNIETSFRDLKTFKMMTTSRDTLTRTILFGLATILLNLWVLANLITLLLYIKTQPKTPPITKKQFKRSLRQPPDTS